MYYILVSFSRDFKSLSNAEWPTHWRWNNRPREPTSVENRFWAWRMNHFYLRFLLGNFLLGLLAILKPLEIYQNITAWNGLKYYNNWIAKTDIIQKSIICLNCRGTYLQLAQRNLCLVSIEDIINFFFSYSEQFPQNFSDTLPFIMKFYHLQRWKQKCKNSSMSKNHAPIIIH